MRTRLVFVLFMVGCVTPAPPSEADLAHGVATPPVVAAPTPPAPPPLPVTAEVEIGGIVTRPPHLTGDVTVWIVDAPCWQPGGRAFNSVKATIDKFFLEVYVPQGTQLWVCAALGDGTKPLTIYGQADRSPLNGKGAGEVTFIGLQVPLVKGKKVAAPGKR